MKSYLYRKNCSIGILAFLLSCGNALGMDNPLQNFENSAFTQANASIERSSETSEMQTSSSETDSSANEKNEPLYMSADQKFNYLVKLIRKDSWRRWNECIRQDAFKEILNDVKGTELMKICARAGAVDFARSLGCLRIAFLSDGMVDAGVIAVRNNDKNFLKMLFRYIPSLYGEIFEKASSDAVNNKLTWADVKMMKDCCPKEFEDCLNKSYLALLQQSAKAKNRDMIYDLTSESMIEDQVLESIIWGQCKKVFVLRTSGKDFLNFIVENGSRVRLRGIFKYILISSLYNGWQELSDYILSNSHLFSHEPKFLATYLRIAAGQSERFPEDIRWTEADPYKQIIEKIITENNLGLDMWESFQSKYGVPFYMPFSQYFQDRKQNGKYLHENLLKALGWDGEYENSEDLNSDAQSDEKSEEVDSADRNEGDKISEGTKHSDTQEEMRDIQKSVSEKSDAVFVDPVIPSSPIVLRSYSLPSVPPSPPRKAIACSRSR